MPTRNHHYPTRSHGRVTIYQNHRAIAHSKNLRGILDYARKIKWSSYQSNVPTWVEFVSVFPVGTGQFPRGDVLIRFHDGATCLVHFESFELACHFIESRRSWGLQPVIYPESILGIQTYTV